MAVNKDDMFYYECKTECQIVDDILNFIKERKSWGDYWYWDHMWYPSERFINDPFMLKLAHRARFKVGILKGPPKSCYDWHDDNPARNYTLNLLLNPEIDSKCVFSKDRMDKQDQAIRDGILTHKNLPFVGIIDICELKYQPRKFYLFNTKIDHVVFNFSDEERYLISLEFQGDAAKLEYHEMLQLIKEIEKED